MSTAELDLAVAELLARFPSAEERQRILELTQRAATESYEGERPRVFINGCFDLMHAGHYNAVRQAAATAPGCHLVVGVHPSAAVKTAKGANCVNTDAEKRIMAEATRWTGEVVEDVPYHQFPEAYLDELRCEFATHGDDMPTCGDGSGMYDQLLAANRMRIFTRTEGISSTNLINRILMAADGTIEPRGLLEAEEDPFLATCERIREFTSRCPERERAQRVVYLHGDWDLFHPGHIALLRAARERGDFVLVGVHADDVVQAYVGRPPVMSMFERVFNLLACKYVDDVIMGAPFVITDKLVRFMRIEEVVTDSAQQANLAASFDAPRAAGILSDVCSVQSPTAAAGGAVALSTEQLIARISDNRDMYLARKGAVALPRATTGSG